MDRNNRNQDVMSEFIPKNLGKMGSRNQSMMAINIDSQDGEIVGIDQGAVTIASTTPNRLN